MMIRKTLISLSRSSIHGPDAQFSLSRFGKLNLGLRSSNSIKEAFRLENQKYMQKDVERERRYAICKKCGNISLVVNFDRVPSARLGLMGKCKDGRDFTHHKYVAVTPSDYRRMQKMDKSERLNYFFFERDTS